MSPHQNNFCLSAIAVLFSGLTAGSIWAQAPAAARPDPQQEMINAMVARLAQRLATKGGDAEEWMRLIRAYKVLNESDKAQGALADARKALASDAAGQGKLTELAQELGLTGK